MNALHALSHADAASAIREKSRVCETTGDSGRSTQVSLTYCGPAKCQPANSHLAESFCNGWRVFEGRTLGRRTGDVWPGVSVQSALSPAELAGCCHIASLVFRLLPLAVAFFFNYIPPCARQHDTAHAPTLRNTLVCSITAILQQRLAANMK